MGNREFELRGIGFFGFPPSVFRRVADGLHGLDVELYTQVGGDPTRIGLLGRYKDMGAVGKMEARIAKDAKWADILKRARGLVVDGSVKDEFWKKN